MVSSYLRRTSVELTASSSELNLLSKSKPLVYPPKSSQTFSQGKLSQTCICLVVEPRGSISSIAKRRYISTYVVAGKVVNVGLGKHGIATEENSLDLFD
jgi:hypothetical protein